MVEFIPSIHALPVTSVRKFTSMQFTHLNESRCDEYTDFIRNSDSSAQSLPAAGLFDEPVRRDALNNLAKWWPPSKA